MSSRVHASYHPGVSTQIWRLSPLRSIVLDRPRLLGILNVTPDSFNPASRHVDPAEASEAAARLIHDGADAIDVGGESTRPGALDVSAEEQIARVLPVIRAIRSLPGDASNIPITIDTTVPSVAQAALDAGADAINDVSGGLDGRRDAKRPAAMFDLAAARSCGMILMHRRSAPVLDQYSDRYDKPPSYADVVAQVRAFLGERAAAAVREGVSADGIVLDPGLGFGKTAEQNLELVRGTGLLMKLGFPVLSALSRKSFVGRVSLHRDSSPAERLAGTIGLSVAHMFAGARLFRVHDVREHAQALAAAWSVSGGALNGDSHSRGGRHPTGGGTPGTQPA